MSSLFNFVTGQRQAPRRIPTDTVIPLNSRDDTVQNRNLALEFTMRFDDILDAQQLVDALWKLLTKPGWKKLGARLRMNNHTGRLEYHVPAQYTKERPPINFSQKTYDMRLEEHAIGRKIPSIDDSERIQVFGGLWSMNEFMQAEDVTKELSDWIYTDKAQLGLRVVNFQDATLVTMTWLHSLLDGMGRRALLDAWIAVLEGRDEDVPEFWGYDFDPLEKLGAPLQDAAKSSEASAAGSKISEQQEKQRGFSTAISGIKNWILRLLDFRSAFAYLFSHIFKPAETVGYREIYMPKSQFARLRTEAMRDLASLDSSQITYSNSNPSNSQPFLSDGDILSAWLIRHIAFSDLRLLQSPPTRPIRMLNVLGMRDLLSKATDRYEVLIPKNKAYTGNCATGIISNSSLERFLRLPLGHVAAQLRKDLTGQATREALEATQRAIRSAQQANTPPPPNASMAPATIIISNWAKGKFFESDFSAAIVPGTGSYTGDRGSRGKPTYIHVAATDKRTKFSKEVSGGIGSCVGKDARGGYWLNSMLAKEFEGRFDKAILEG
jgi:hypothetical protein